MELRPFTVHVPDTVLTDLRARLANVSWPDEPPDAGWRYGTDLRYLQALVAYWRDAYDRRRAHEAVLNAFSQFIVPLDKVRGRSERLDNALVQHCRANAAQCGSCRFSLYRTVKLLRTLS